MGTTTYIYWGHFSAFSKKGKPDSFSIQLDRKGPKFQKPFFSVNDDACSVHSLCASQLWRDSHESDCIIRISQRTLLRTTKFWTIGPFLMLIKRRKQALPPNLRMNRSKVPAKQVRVQKPYIKGSQSNQEVDLF